MSAGKEKASAAGEAPAADACLFEAHCPTSGRRGGNGVFAVQQITVPVTGLGVFQHLVHGNALRYGFIGIGRRLTRIGVRRGNGIVIPVQHPALLLMAVIGCVPAIFAAAGAERQRQRQGCQQNRNASFHPLSSFSAESMRYPRLFSPLEGKPIRKKQLLYLFSSCIIQLSGIIFN